METDFIDWINGDRFNWLVNETDCINFVEKAL